MARARICDADECCKTETDPTELELFWLTVGFADDPYDACSPACARWLLSKKVAPAIKEMNKSRAQAEAAADA